MLQDPNPTPTHSPHSHTHVGGTHFTSPTMNYKTMSPKTRKALIILGVILLIVLGYFLYKTYFAAKTNPVVDDYNRKLSMLAKKVEENPDDAAAVQEYGYALYVTNNSKEAQGQYEKIVQNNAQDYEAQNILGTLYRNNGEYEKAIAAYEKAIEINPQIIHPYINLAHLYMYNYNQNEKGYEVLNRAIAQFPDDTNIKIMLAKAYQQNGDNTKAKTLYDEVLRLDPANEVAQDAVNKMNSGQ